VSKTLYITNPNFNFSKINKNSLLLTNLDIPLDHDEYHTSLGDLPAESILSIINKFSLVTFIPDLFIIDSDIYSETIFLLTYISHRVPVNNLIKSNVQTFTNLDVSNRPNKPVLWVFGCSHSHGVGLLKGELRYSDIISDTLGLPLYSITKPGSSLHWSLRHLTNANIFKNDLVIWQITTPERVSIYKNNVREIMLANTSDKHLLEVYSDEQIDFNHLTLLNFGTRYLRSKKIKFLMTSIGRRPSEYAKYPEYCYVPNLYIDRGADRSHAGPLSHKKLASALLDRV